MVCSVRGTPQAGQKVPGETAAADDGGAIQARSYPCFPFARSIIQAQLWAQTGARSPATRILWAEFSSQTSVF
jgi:hypothetical protein